MTAPCKDCEKRTLGCHASCEAYQAFRQEREKINAARYKEKATLDRPGSKTRLQILREGRWK